MTALGWGLGCFLAAQLSGAGLAPSQTKMRKGWLRNFRAETNRTGSNRGGVGIYSQTRTLFGERTVCSGKVVVPVYAYTVFLPKTERKEGRKEVQRQRWQDATEGRRREEKRGEERRKEEKEGEGRRWSRHHFLTPLMLHLAREVLTRPARLRHDSWMTMNCVQLLLLSFLYIQYPNSRTFHDTPWCYWCSTTGRLSSSHILLLCAFVHNTRMLHWWALFHCAFWL